MKIKFLMEVGGLLAVGSFLSIFAILKYGGNISGSMKPFLGLVILGTIGVLTFIVGLVVLLFSQSKQIRKISAVVLGLLVLTLSVPLISWCPEMWHDNDPMTLENDVVVCKILFPYQPTYWVGVYDIISNSDNNNSRHEFIYFAGALIILRSFLIFM